MVDGCMMDKNTDNQQSAQAVQVDRSGRRGMPGGVRAPEKRSARKSQQKNKQREIIDGVKRCRHRKGAVYQAAFGINSRVELRHIRTKASADRALQTFLFDHNISRHG